MRCVEDEIVGQKTVEILSQDLPDIYDLSLLQSLHRKLFSDIYDFAGKLRTVNIMKPDSEAPFAYADCIPMEARRIFDELRAKNYLAGLGKNDFAQELAGLAAELNALHPFREGNGRTIRLFLILLAQHAGYVLNFGLARYDEILMADKLAFSGDSRRLVELYGRMLIAL